MEGIENDRGKLKFFFSFFPEPFLPLVLVDFPLSICFPVMPLLGSFILLLLRFYYPFVTLISLLSIYAYPMHMRKE